MDIKDLKSLIAAGESQTVEFKTAFSNEAVETIAAFSNTSGGTVFLGVADNAQIIELNLTAEKIQQWVNEVKTKTTPAILPEAVAVSLDGKTIAALKVEEYPIKPVSIKGRYYKRVGNANHLMSPDEVAQAHYKTFNSSWDYTTDPEHTLADISLAKVESFLSLANKNREIALTDAPVATLRKLELLRAEGISKACFLLFMMEESLLTTIELGRFQTETLIKDACRAKTDLFSEIESTMQFLLKHLNKRYIITGNPQREERWDYPMEALREIVINAIVHRDYSCPSDSVIKIFDDKIEFYNPGRLCGDLTVAKLLKGNYISTIRNKQIAGIFKEAGIMEKYGSGIRRIVEAFRNSGLPAPRFREMGEGFMVTVFHGAPQKTPQEPRGKGVVGGLVGGLAESQKKICEAMRSNPSVSKTELAKLLGISATAIDKNISVLKRKSLIRRVGPDTGGHWEVL